MEVVQFYFRHCGTTAALPADDLAEIAHTGPEAGRNSITYIIIFIYFLNWIFKNIFSAALQCYVCGSTHAHGHGRCDDGEVGTLQTCDHGEKSCVYGKVKGIFIIIVTFLRIYLIKIMMNYQI